MIRDLKSRLIPLLTRGLPATRDEINRICYPRRFDRGYLERMAGANGYEFREDFVRNQYSFERPKR